MLGWQKEMEKGGICHQEHFASKRVAKHFQKWRVVPGPGGRRPVADKNTCSIYAIVHLKNGKTYVGRTIKSPYVRFQEHISTTDALG